MQRPAMLLLIGANIDGAALGAWITGKIQSAHD